MNIKECSFTNNTSDQDGGGIYTWGTSDIQDVECDFNVAIDKGGCLYTRGYTTLDMTIIGNDGYFGGSIYSAYGSNVEIYGGYYSNSTSPRNGGFIYISDGGSVDIYGGVVEFCSAVRKGAIAYVSGTSDDISDLGGGTLHIHNGIFRRNSAGELGGGFAIWGNTTKLVISGGVYSDNYALYSGGLLFLEQFATFEASNCLFENNLADDQGGVVYARDPTYFSVSCTSINNRSPYASYIYISHSVETSYINNSVVTYNTSEDSDSSIYAANSVVVIDNVFMESVDKHSRTIAVRQTKDSDVTITNSMFRGWYGESIITTVNPTDNTTRIIECDFRETYSTQHVASSSKVLIVNALTTSENDSLFTSNSSTCEDHDICDGCIENELGVICICSTIQCHLGSEISVSIIQEPSRIFYYPNIIGFIMSVSNHDNDSVIWDMNGESEKSSISTMPGTGISNPGESYNIYIYVKIFPEENGIDSTLFSFSGPFINDIVIPVTHSWYRCMTGEIEVIVDDDVSCTPCANYLKEVDGETGYDCNCDGITLEELYIKPGFWRSSNQIWRREIYYRVLFEE